MTNNNETNDVLPINQKATRHAFADIWQAVMNLKQTLLRAADYSPIIGSPATETKKQLTSAIMDLIAATAEATHKLQHHQARRKAANTAKPASSTPPNQNAPDRTKPDTTNDPPSTDNLAKLDRELNTHILERDTDSHDNTTAPPQPEPHQPST